MFTIIPAKPFTEAKSRLAPILAPSQRVALSRYLLQRTIQVAHQVSQRVVVVSRSVMVRRLAKQAGAWSLVETRPGLNEALQQGLRWASAQGEQAVLILPGDLPYLQPISLQMMIAQATKPPTVVIAPCQRNEGTNALFMHPLNLIEVAFGLSSFTRHCQATYLQGIKPRIFRHPTLAFDLDVPDDWQQYHLQEEPIEDSAERPGSNRPYSVDK